MEKTVDLKVKYAQEVDQFRMATILKKLKRPSTVSDQLMNQVDFTIYEFL